MLFIIKYVTPFLALSRMHVILYNTNVILTVIGAKLSYVYLIKNGDMQPTYKGVCSSVSVHLLCLDVSTGPFNLIYHKSLGFWTSPRSANSSVPFLRRSEKLHLMRVAEQFICSQMTGLSRRPSCYGKTLPNCY